MKKFTQIIGFCGLVVTLLGLFARIIQGQGSLVITLHLVLGGVLLLLGMLTNLSELRETAFKRGARYGTGAFVQLFLWIVALGLVNSLALSHNRLWDLTQGGIYTLSEPTRRVLERLPGPIAITAFVQSDSQDEARQRLELYAEASPNLRVEFVDPDKHPEIAESKAISAYGTLLFEYGGKAVRVTQRDEADITNAIVKATRSGEKTIYFLSGHEEADPGDEDKAGLSILRGALEDQNYRLQGFFLTGGDVPANAALVVVASPRIPLTTEEVQALERYLAQGGDALFLIDPLYETGLEPLLQKYGITLRNDVVIDPVHYLSSKDQIGISPICEDFRKHPVTENLAGKLLVFSRARSLAAGSEPFTKRVAVPLVLTSDQSYSETNLELLRTRGLVRPDPEDKPGPLAVAAAASARIPQQPWEKEPGNRIPPETRLAVVGNSRFLRNGDLTYYSNFLFALNLINWLAGEDEYIYLPTVKRTGNRIFLSGYQKESIFYASVLILPELLMIIGIAIWWRRR